MCMYVDEELARFEGSITGEDYEKDAVERVIGREGIHYIHVLPPPCLSLCPPPPIAHGAV